nr:hypothetical protein [Kutzneria buriramensis]WKX06042.1 hypothetical protein Q4V64_00430 [Kutzneria buriramensis]
MGDGEEIVRWEHGVKSQDADHRLFGEGTAGRQQVLGWGDEARDLPVHLRKTRLLMEGARLLHRVHGARRCVPQAVDGVQRVVPWQLPYFQEPLAAAAQIDHGRAVAADRHAGTVNMPGDDIHPACPAAGDEEDFDAGFRGGG